MSNLPVDYQRSLPASRSRDRELVRYVGRHGLVTVAHIMAAMGVGQAITYRRLARCIRAGLLERHLILASEPSLIRATQAGIRWAGLGLPVASLSPGGVDHYLRCASVAQMLFVEFESASIYTEPEIPVIEAILGQPLASAEITNREGRRARMHRADLVVSREDGNIAVEVELTPKAPHRLKEIIRAWRRTRCVSEVRYYCRPGAAYGAVSRAVETVHAGEKVKVIQGVPK